MKNIKNIALILVLIVSLLTLAACSTSPEATVVDKVGEDLKYIKVSIKHELDEEEVVIENKPQRVIVFDYGVLDTLDNIGEDIIGLPKKTLPSYLSKYSAENYEDLGTLQEPNFETIYELQPDLIIISGRQMALYEEFKKIAPTVYLTIDGGDYINSFKHNVEILGQIFNKEELIAEKVTEIESAIIDLKEQASTSDMNSLFVMANDGNISAYGVGSRFGILHKEFGLKAVDENIESSNHGQKITFEYIAEKDPDYLFVMDRAAVAGGDTTANQVMENELIFKTKAYNNDNIINLDAHIWYVSSGGITGTMTMIEEVQQALNK